MEFEDFGNTLKNMVLENQDKILETWETFPAHIQQQINEELEKVKSQIEEYNKKEQ